MAALLLGLSISLSTVRNLLSKKLSALRFGSRAFFVRQSLLFFFGGLAIAVFGGISFRTIAPQPLLYAAIYGLLLIFAQWFYTMALGGGNTALCSTVYSMGFILPTLSGAIFWAEAFSWLNGLGVGCAVAAIFFSSASPKKSDAQESRWSFLPLLVAMLASGGLGIMQKVQQKSACADEKTEFLVMAFFLAAILSLIASVLSEKQEGGVPQKGTLWFAVCVGAAFGSCNLLNTALAGMLPSAIFFPTLNIGVILATMLCGIFLFKERIQRKELLVLTLGGASILLLTLF